MATIEIEWQHRVNVGNLLRDETDRLRYFRQGAKVRYKSAFDLSPRYSFDIHSFQLGDGLLRKIARALNPESTSNRAGLPIVNLPIGAHKGNITKISAEIFPANSLLIRISAKFLISTGEAGLPDLYQQLGSLRSARKLNEIRAIYDLVLEHLISDNSQNLVPSTRFAFLIELPTTEAEFRRRASRNRKLLTAFHIGVTRHEDLAISLVDDVEKRCQALNLKSVTELMIANSQGVTYVLPAMEHSSPYKSRFTKAADLLAIATYCQQLLLDNEDLESADPDLWLKLVRVSRRWISFPGNTLHTSVSNRVFWDVLVDSFHLNSLIDELVVLNKIDDRA